jgi:hypothetical protein
MRSTKLLTLLVAAFTAAVLGLTTLPAEAAKPPHRLENFAAGIANNSKNILWAKGKAPTAKGQRIYLQYAKWGSHRWHTKESTLSTKKTGRFYFRFKSGCGVRWRLYIKADKQQRNTSKFTYNPERPEVRKYFARWFC